MKHLHRILLFVLALSAAPALSAADGNAALYDPVAPPDSAFVRLFNHSNTSVTLKVSSKTAAQTVSNGQLGGYLFVAAGSHTLTVGAASLPVTLTAKSALTVLYDGTSLVALNDTYEDDRKKAQVAFYNLTSNALSLRTADGKHVIVDKLERNSTGSRMINEIKIRFAAYADSGNVASFSEMFLKKGRSYSYIVVNEGEQVKTLALANTIDPIE